jgi:hypothetical protein
MMLEYFGKVAKGDDFGFFSMDLRAMLTAA